VSQYLYDPNNPPAPEIEAKLRALGVRFVLATPVPTAEGMVAEERAAVQDGDVWRQAWELVPAPEPEPEDRPVPALTAPQFEFLLVVTGLADVWDAVQDAVRAQSLEQYAVLRALRKRDSFRFETTVAMVETFAPFLPEGVVLNAETLLPMWLQAAAADI
jgi:hypothetical protein